MKKIIVLAVLAAMAGQAAAGIIFSGETWETFDNFGASATGSDAVSGWVDQQANGVAWSGDSAIGLNKTYSVGDTVSFTVSTSAVGVGSGTGDNSNNWLGAFYGGLSSTPLDWSTAYSKTIAHEPVYPYAGAVDAEAIVDVSYEFISATEAIYTQDGSSTNIAVNVADVAAIYVGTWNTQKTMTVSNFAVTAIPEPGTFGLVAAFGGCILFIRRKLMM